MIMDIVLTKDEKKLFIKIQKLRDAVSHKSLNIVSIEELFVKNIVINNLANEGIDPTLGQFDALVDDIELSIKRRFNEFLEFLREEKGI